MTNSNFREELAAPGVLSVVVQGGVFEGNATDVANICAHWRVLFPQSEIICSISSSDVFLSGGNLIALTKKGQNNWSVGVALNKLQASCNKIVFAEAMLPLPAIKLNDPPCNGNLQIAAARKGLETATGKYILRMRNDAFFANDSFVDEYIDSLAYERRENSFFESRVLISDYFTLNPYGNYERLPFHFSDWFHFGLKVDVEKIWGAQYLTLQDITYYKSHCHVPGSTENERRFFTRIAVEQHIIFECFRKSNSSLKLDYVNDLSSRDESVQILLDNFSICDTKKCGLVFDKYRKVHEEHITRFKIIAASDFAELARNRDVSPEKLLKRTFSGLTVVGENDFPKVFQYDWLHSKVGYRNSDGQIVLEHPMVNGVLVFGPFISLPIGDYAADVYVTTLEGSKRGKVTLRATLSHGRTHLTERKIDVIDYVGGALTILFSNSIKDAHDFEVIVEVEGVTEMAVEKIIIRRR